MPYSATITGQTGQGSTVTIASAVGCVRSVTLPTFSMDSIDASCLSDTGFMKKISADLSDAGEVQIVAAYGGASQELTGEQETITITFGDGGSLSGTGFISAVDHGSLETGGLMETTTTFTFDGDTGPAYSAA
jgi:hypothetical protein